MKKIVLIIAMLGVFATAGATVFGVAKASSSKSAFEDGGYVLLGNGSGDGKKIEVDAGTVYSPTVAGTISFKGSDGSAASAPLESFVTYNDDSVAAFTSGIILDFNDLSGNFINNYCVPAGMRITRNGSSYYANTASGDITFGDHIWKLTDSKYLVCSPELAIHFADDDIRTAEDFVQVCVAEDGIVRLLTPDNLWTTLTSDCYITTQSGVTVTPVTQRIEDDNYKLSLASMSVNADDNIVLTEDEVRRQIVPEIKINTIDGTDGSAGEDGISGEAGEDGEQGTNGIAGIAGTDGENGNDGAQGTSGSSGSSGSGGSSGTNGQNGATGIQGEGSQSSPEIANLYNGANGSDGAMGNAGASGEDGSGGRNGNIGTTGDGGQDGDGGSNGAAGEEGDPGAGGEDGDDGSGGSTGDSGGQGKNGRDADGTSGSKTQIPAITINGWEVYSTGVRGAIYISDPDEFFKGVESATDHPANVTVINKNTGEEIKCEYYKNDQYLESKGVNFFAAINDPDGSHQSTVYFALNPENQERLAPDTEYILKVTAYYCPKDANGQYTPNVYYRNFVSRSFYTDSTGINLTLEDLNLKLAEDNTTQYATAEVGVNKADGAVVSAAEVYLLTEEQNRQFSITQKGNFVYKYSITYGGTTTYTGFPKEKGAQTGQQTAEDPSFISLPYVPTTGIVTEGTDLGGLDSDTAYIARVIVTTEYAGKSGPTLSPQELEVTTLKKSPYWTSTEYPKANYNRLTGSFDVSRPAVTDPDGAVVQYTYIPYVLQDGQWVKLSGKARTIAPGVQDPVSFDLPTTYQDGQGNTQSYHYKFEVDIEAFDNEKNVVHKIFNSADTEGVWTDGASLPVFNFVPTVQEFNYVKGTLHVRTDQGTSMIVDETKPLTLVIYGDEYYENTIVLKELPGETGTVCGIRSGVDEVCTHADPLTGKCTCASCSRECDCGCDWWVTGHTGNPGQGIAASEFEIDVALDELYRNQKYTVVVNGTLLVGTDSNGNPIYSERELGAFTFRTPVIGAVSANWQELIGTSDPLNVKLTLEGYDTAETNELKKGQVTLQLYSGKGENKAKIKAKMLNKSADLDQLYGSGLTITQSTFDLDKLVQGSEYTIEVLYVQDKTYSKVDDKYDYDNRTSNISNASKIIQAKKTPPDLPQYPNKAITATPILNKNAAAYGETVNEDLADDAVIGYMLQSEYDNINELAYQVRYYAFEFTDFWAAVKQGIDPVGNYLYNGQDLYKTGGQVGIPKLGMWTRTFDSTSSKPAKIVVLFGNETTTDENAIVSGGYAKYYISPLETVDGAKKGMSRGYRYIFAYTVEYNNGTAQSVYPYGDPDDPAAAKAFQDAVDNYGIGQMILNKKVISNPGKGLAYVLNSGIQEAPKGDPKFHTYLANVTDVQLLKFDDQGTSLQNFYTSGKAHLRYYYIDYDEAIDRTIDLNVSYNYLKAESGSAVSATGYAELADKTLQKAWNELELTYLKELAGTEGTVPEVALARYVIDYNAGVLGPKTSEGDPDHWGLVEDPKSLSMGAFYPDYDWEDIIDWYNNGITASGTGRKVPSVDISYSESANRVLFLFNTPENDSFTRRIMERSFMAKITAKDSQNNTQEFDLPIEIVSVKENEGTANERTVDRFAAVLNTSLLGEGGSKKGDYTFTAQLYLDNGYQGWDLLDPASAAYADNGFGLYYYEKGISGGLSGKEYFVKNNATEAYANGGLFEASTAAVDFSPNLALEPTRIKSNYKYVNGTRFTRFLYTMEKGVDYLGESAYIGNTDSNILVPKKAGVMTCYFGNGSSTTGGTKINIILPVVYWQNYNGLSRSIALNAQSTDDEGTPQDFHLTGFKDAAVSYQKSAEPLLADETELSDEYYILNAQLFPGTEEGKRDAQKDSCISQGTNRIEIVLDDDSKIYGTIYTDGQGTRTFVRTTYNSTEKTWENLPELGNGELDLDTSYTLSMYMELHEEGTATGNHVLMSHDADAIGERSVYPVATAGSVTVTLSGISYDVKNLSYFSKGLSFQFNLKPRAYGLKMKYEIYASQEDAQEGMPGATPVIDFNVIPGSRYIDASYLKTTGNKVSVDLSPSKLLDDFTAFGQRITNLVPGRTYWLRLSAYNKSGEEQLQAYMIGSFAIPYNKITAGVTQGRYRSDAKVSFKVQVRDIGHLSMGYHYDAADPVPTIDLDEGAAERKYNDEGLYAVRFTDANGKRFHTVYDNFVFSYADLNQEFLLSYDTMMAGHQEALAPDTSYYCNIYVVQDLDLDGKSGKADNTDDTVREGWRYFFNDPNVSANRLKFGNYTVKYGPKPEETVTYRGFELPGGFNTLLDTLWDDQDNERKTGDYAKLRTQFLLARKERKTAPAQGIIDIDSANARFAINGDTGYTFRVMESWGVVTLNEQGEQVQGFDKIEYSIVREDNGEVFEGTLLKGTHDASMFVGEIKDGALSGTCTLNLLLGDENVIADGVSYQISLTLTKYAVGALAEQRFQFSDRIMK